MGNPRKFQDVGQLRKGLLARVHMAKKRLGLDDDTYRAMMENGWGRRSAGELPPADLRAFCNTLERSAHTGKYAGNSGYPGRPRNMETAKGPLLSKVEALLTGKGHRQGSPVPWNYAHAIARNMYRVEIVQWCSAAQLRGVITALEKDAQRAREKEAASGRTIGS